MLPLVVMVQAGAAAALNVDEECHSALLTSHVEVIENPMSCGIIPRDVVLRDSTSRVSSHRASDIYHQPADDHDDDDDEINPCVGKEADAEEQNVGLAGALEMLPIPCTVSGAPGLPAILLVNPPTDISAAAVSAADDDVHDDDRAASASAENQLRANNRCTAASSTLKRLSVTRMNFYMRYLQPKNRSATRRERKATKTLAIVLGLLLALSVVKREPMM